MLASTRWFRVPEGAKRRIWNMTAATTAVPAEPYLHPGGEDDRRARRVLRERERERMPG